MTGSGAYGDEYRVHRSIGKCPRKAGPGGWSIAELTARLPNPDRQKGNPSPERGGIRANQNLIMSLRVSLAFADRPGAVMASSTVAYSAIGSIADMPSTGMITFMPRKAAPLAV